MPAENLTRIEAQERASVITKVHSYEVALDVTGGPETFASTTTVRFDAVPGSSTFIDFVQATIHQATLNGEPVDTSGYDGTRLDLTGLAASNELVVVADARYTNSGEGLHRFVDPVDGEVYLYTQFEVPDSRRVYPVFEQPDLKATFQFTVTAPAHWEVISNEPTVGEPAPAASLSGGEARTWTFATTPVMSSYITAIVAGPYTVVRDELTSSDGRTIPLGVFCRSSLAEHLDADYIFDITRRGFEFFEEMFDFSYPFTKYDQIFVPEFNAGAMENAGAITFTEAYVFRSKVTDAMRERRVVTILHELAHMWFGDLVTMRWWNDLWLNESFAEYISTLATAEATEWTEAWTTFAALEKSWAYRQDQLPSTHPIVADIRDLEDVQVNFDGITYAKGGSVLKQLVAWVGREHFVEGIRAYFQKHAWGNTELRDLLVELEAASGRDLTTWSKLWLETAGVNTLRPEISVAEDGAITEFAIVQTAPAEWPTIRPHRLAIGLYEEQDGALVRVDRIELDIDGERTDVPELLGRVRPALILLNDDDLAYAKIRLDEASLHAATAGLGSLADPLARSLVWGSAWDATRDGEVPASEFIELILNNLGAETESTTIRTVLGQLATAVRHFTAPAKRAERLVQVGDAVWGLAEAAAPGSDLQFQLVKAFAQFASTEVHAQILSDLHAGTRTLPGLTVDTDLRWELLEGLVLVGKAGEAEIAAALAADDTATGRQAAARARATVQGEAAKLATLQHLLTDESLPNLIVRNSALGFQRSNDPETLRATVPVYFDALTAIWQTRSYHMAEELIEGLYPAGLADEALADAARGWLAANADAAPALRRLVTEALAGTERALQAQAVDASA